MKIDLKIQYKSETGEPAFLELESKHLTGSLSGNEFEGMSGREIIDMLSYDFKRNAQWGVYLSDMPVEYNKNGDLKIYTPEYVQWLENKLENK